VDFKGPNLTENRLKQIVETIEDLHISSNVAIFATALEEGEIGPGVDILQTFEGDDNMEHKVQLGLVLRDRVEKDNDEQRVQSLLTKYTAVKLFAPSNKFDLDYFERISSFGLPVMAWTVDNQEGLIHAIKAGLSAIISNDPINLNKIRNRIRQRCQQY